MGGRYAQDKPLSLNASITFEQAYDSIDGDSASAAELIALLSSLADAPIKQSLAVTGSINQHGEIQAIGGVSDKIEGFFEACKAMSPGLSGEQGVVIPASNVKVMTAAVAPTMSVRTSRRAWTIRRATRM